MNKFNKAAVLGLASLFMCATAVNAEVVEPQGAGAQNQKMEKTSDAGKVIFRIENIKPIKDKEGNVKQCSYIVTAYNRMNRQIKSAELDFSWQDNITGQYIKKIDDSAKINSDEITEQLSSDAKEMRKNVQDKNQREELQFKPILSSLKVFNIAPHSQKSFSNTVDTDKCFLLFDNLGYRVKNCELGDQRGGGVSAGKDGCNNSFQYISSKNPEYYVAFSDVPESVVQDQIEEEKNMELEKINANYNDIISTLEKLDDTLKNMR